LPYFQNVLAFVPVGPNPLCSPNQVQNVLVLKIQKYKTAAAVADLQDQSDFDAFVVVVSVIQQNVEICCLADENDSQDQTPRGNVLLVYTS